MAGSNALTRTFISYSEGRTRQMDVLIVDDDLLTRQGLMKIMPWSEFNMQVVGEAGNGLEALRFLNGHHVDLVLCDLDK